MNIILFSLLANPAEHYLSKEFSKPVKFKKTINALKGISLDKKVDKAIKKIKKPKNNNFEESSILKSIVNNMANIAGYAKETFEALNGIKFGIKNFYDSLADYKKSKYAAKKKTDGKNCWQVGIDVSRTCNFIFFPKKEKKVIGQMVDKGIILDYINPAPALCYF